MSENTVCLKVKAYPGTISQISAHRYETQVERNQWESETLDNGVAELIGDNFKIVK